MSIHTLYSKNQPSLETLDSDVYHLLLQEEERQRNKLELIASENFTSRAVMEATASVLTNKYAEGYPGKRYYGGCEVVDEVENIAIERAKQLFQAEYANVQPHSGSSANVIIFSAFLKPGDCIMGMDLAHGGHLSHGSPVSITGQIYKSVFYGVEKESGRLNYDSILKLAHEHKPKILIAGASAYSRIIDFARFAEIAEEVGALLLVDMAHIAGLIAAGLHPSPIPHADFVTTTTHKTLRGPRGGLILVGKNKEFMKGEKTRKYSGIINSANMPGLQGGPLMHVIAAKAVAFKECLQDSFVEYQKQVIKNAATLAETLRKGSVRIISGGTDNHLLLADVKSSFGITGKDAELWLDEANITANKNGIPFDTESPFVSSGIRFGLPALTSRGMKEKDIQSVGEYILAVFRSEGDSKKLEAIGEKVLQLSSNFAMRE